jgi:hypothetical protein
MVVVARAVIATLPEPVVILMSKSFAPKVYQSKWRKYANYLRELHGRLQWVDGEWL